MDLLFGGSATLADEPKDEMLCKPQQITKITGDKAWVVDDYLLTEVMLDLYVNGEKIMKMYCLPRAIKQLVTGYLFCNRYINGVADIKNLQIDIAGKKILVVAEALGERVGGYQGEVTLTPQEVHRFQNLFNTHGELYQKTGSAHSCALADAQGILILMEDVARHNSLDKTIGEMLLHQVNPGNKMFIFSGRLAADMLKKVIAIGVKVLISPGAPSLAAVKLAEEHNITLLGFVNKTNINVYTHPQRIELQ